MGNYLARYESEVKSIEGMKAALAVDLAGVLDAERIGSRANSIAHAEGKARVYHLVGAMQGRGALKAEILEAVYDLLVQGADDEWSGRGNEIKRSRYDGIRAAAADLRYSL